MQASIDNWSLIDPPGWIIAFIPYLAHSSTISLNGKNASEASIVAPWPLLSASCVGQILLTCPPPIPTATPSLRRGEGATILASDAFFPFRDIVDECSKYGIKAIIQPGGSMRDQESIDACNEHGIAMVFTGIRHFKH